jgi:2-oxoisovalerate dehydrogenase E1 component
VKHSRDDLTLTDLRYDRATASGIDPARDPQVSQLLAVYRSMLVARAVDSVEVEMTSGGEAFFHVSGWGHEGSAILNQSLIPQDWLHLHYRDKALMLARGIPPAMFFHSSLCNALSHSAGRQMSAHLSDPARRILSTVGPVGNNALQAVGVASAIKLDPEHPIVVCSMGDGTTQQGEVLEAIAEAVRSELPVLFWIEDNAYAISTKTRSRTFYSLPQWCGGAEHFYGLPIHRLNGRDILSCSEDVQSIVEGIRRTRRPSIAVFEVDRLSDHTNSDDERVYRPREEIERVRRRSDPIRVLTEWLAENGVSRLELDAMAEEVSAEVRHAADLARHAPDPLRSLDAKKPLPTFLSLAGSEYRGESDKPGITMLEAIRDVLRLRMAADPRISLYGQDIEDPKGDVFGVTQGLTLAFPGRVNNSPLSESTIVGLSIGQALAGARPVALIQFADFLPLAFNQIVSELGSIYWRTAGGWDSPVIIMAPCGGYRPGLGPFHAQTLESVMAHVPGVDVVMPSDAADAAGLLNAAFESGRPTIFLYPKSCLNDRNAMTSADVERHLVPLGKSRWLSRGEDLTIVTWGSTVRLCQRVVAHLNDVEIGVDLIDLRSISPWDQETVCESSRRTGKVIVVHEDNLTCGFGAEVIATVAERAGRHVLCRRIARPDTYVPCNFANQLEVLPSARRILEAAADLLRLEMSWEVPARQPTDLFAVEANGASPADQTVTVIAWLVSPGDEVRAGQRIAEVESDKSVLDLASPVEGKVDSIVIEEGEPVGIGTVLALIDVRQQVVVRRTPIREEPGVPRLRKRSIPSQSSRGAAAGAEESTTDEVGMSQAYCATGTRDFRNSDIIQLFPRRTVEEVSRRFGIDRRHRLAADESVLTIAVRAGRDALEHERLSIDDIDLIVCSTNTPIFTVPSLACLILHSLSSGRERGETAAYDLTAACTGYLYGLSAGHDFLRSRPSGRVMIVTAEAMSHITDPTDYFTTTHFSDAASATILHGRDLASGPWARLRRPVIGARGEKGDALRVELQGQRRVVMDGKTALTEAVPRMVEALCRACDEAGIRPADLDLLVPHQGSHTMINGLRTRLNLPEEKVFNNLKVHGNTSSSSIPLCLSELAERENVAGRIGLSAFGGGFTFGAAIIVKE